MRIADLCGVPDPDGTLWLPPRAAAELADRLRLLRPPPRLDPPTIVHPKPIDPSGRDGPTRGQCRGPGWRRTSPNRFVPADAVLSQPAQRIAEHAHLLPPVGGVTGWASLHLAGARWFDGSTADGAALPVPLALGPRGQRADRDGVAFHRQLIRATDRVVRHGVPCLDVERALLDEMRRTTDLRAAATALAMALHAELTSPARFARFVETQARRGRIDQVRAALALARPGPESPPEVRMHLCWELDAGLPTPLLNRPVFSLDGTFLGRPDLLDPEAGVAGEYDGAHHLEVAHRRRDLAREERLRAHGLEYFTVVGGELSDRDAVAARMSATRERALRARAPRRWTLQPPPWWRAELTLDERLDLRDLLLRLAVPRNVG